MQHHSLKSSALNDFLSDFGFVPYGTERYGYKNENKCC